MRHALGDPFHATVVPSKRTCTRSDQREAVCSVTVALRDSMSVRLIVTSWRPMLEAHAGDVNYIHACKIIVMQLCSLGSKPLRQYFKYENSECGMF